VVNGITSGLTRAIAAIDRGDAFAAGEGGGEFLMQVALLADSASGIKIKVQGAPVFTMAEAASQTGRAAVTLTGPKLGPLAAVAMAKVVEQEGKRQGASGSDNSEKPVTESESSPGGDGSGPKEAEPPTGVAKAKGGAHEDLPIKVGEEQRHHMPADSVSPLSTKRGPCIVMSCEDHQLTADWGSSSEAQAQRQAQRELIEQGRFKEAQQMSIDDVRSKFGEKYNEAIEQMEDYTETIPPEDLTPKKE